MNLSKDLNIQEELKKEGLCYCSDSNPGYFRQNNGKNLVYYDLDGKRINNKKALNRIKGLIIPPAWENVWICPKENGHLQATGVDEKGRKQYLYHPDWIKISEQNKFSKMIDFGLSLPKVREKVRYLLQTKNLDKRKILATMIWLLEHTFIRVGNEEYEKENNSYGLTTLRNKHIQIRNSEVILRFRGKSGVNHIMEISNPSIVSTIKRCIELPGYELFQFIDEDGNRHVVDSKDVNDFLKETTNDDFTAKDFRTWGGTEICANSLYQLGFSESKEKIKQNIVDTVKKVANHLNNTVSVCRNYYIHPTVIKSYVQNVLVPHFGTFRKKALKKPGLTWNEYALIKLLQKYPYHTNT